MLALPLVRAALVRRRRWLAAAAASLTVYAAIGFLLVPYALRRAAPARLEEALGRKVTIERIRVNPFTLSLQMDGFAVLDADGRTPALSWRSLFVDFELWPVLKREARFRAIRLVDPAIHAGLRKDGTPTFDDVIARLRGPEVPAGQASASERQAEPWTIAIGVLDVEAAFLRLRDESRPKPFETTAGPVTLHLESFRTTSDGRSPYAFSGRTEAGEAFSWTGTFQMAPVRSSGTLVLEDLDLAKYAPYYSDTLLAQLRGGRATARGTYEVNLGAERVIRLVDGEVRLRDLALHDRAGGARLLALPSLDVTGIRLDLLASTARVERVETSGGVLSVRRDRAGGTNLEQVVAPSDSSEPFAYEVGAVAVRGWRIELDDRLPARPVALAVSDLDVTLERLSSAPESESPLAASLGWPGGGKLRVEGTVAPNRPAVKLALDADALALAPLEPYLALYGGVLARLSEGSARGKLRVTADLSKAGAPSYAVAGDAGLDGLVLLDANAEEVVRWRALEASAIDVRSGPEGVRLGALRLLEPRLRIVRRPDETTNLEGLAAPPPAASAAPVAPASGKAPPEQPAPFRIGTIAVDGGRVTVTDRTVSPPAVLRYAGLRARLTNFSSDARARTGVDVEALVEGTAPFRVSGTLNPRLVGDVTDLAVRSKGIDLTPLGPYASRYVGYALERGKLDLDLRYRVQQRVLKAANVVRVDQLALGARSDSKDAPSFPMGLALAVLTDRSGVMLLDVPIEGNIDDPEFKLGRVIWRAVLNVLGKVATAPFTALAGLVGGGADAKLDTVDFAPGSARLEPASLAKLDALAKALADRPALKLEVEGLADASADGTALGREALRALAARERWQHASVKQAEAAPAVLTVSDEEYPRYLKAAYESALRAQPARPVPTASGAAPSLEAMEAFLLQGVDLGAALRTLSSERAAAVREGLLARQIDQARLFLSESGGKEQAQPSVRLTLK